MGAINTIIGVPLGYVIYAAYALTHSFGWAIVLFTVVTRVVLFPVNVLAHNNAIRFLKLQPALDKLKRRFAADKEA
ncbi:MAG: preprotein translocase YidC, partial [Actinomycetia bacterium]|nr:preprotein translocase YidC [Actinomycetes bacterium]